MDAARRTAIHDAMVRLSDGDRSALAILIDELWPVVLSFVERGVGRGPDAEDIAQEVFYKVISRTADFDRKRDGLSWAFGIASYEILTHRRRLQRRREVFDEVSFAGAADGADAPEDQLLAREMAAAFQQAVGALSFDDQALLGLRGAAVGVASPAARKRKQRALDRLRGIWRRIYGDA